MKKNDQQLVLLCFLFLNLTIKSKVEELSAFPVSEIGVIGALEDDSSQDFQLQLPQPRIQESSSPDLPSADWSINEILEEEELEEEGGGAPIGAIVGGAVGGAAALGALGFGIYQYLKPSSYKYEKDLKSIQSAYSQLKVLLKEDDAKPKELADKMNLTERAQMAKVTNLLNYVQVNLQAKSISPEFKKVLVDVYVPYIKENFSNLPFSQGLINDLPEVQILPEGGLSPEYSSKYNFELNKINEFQIAERNVEDVKNKILEKDFVASLVLKVEELESKSKNELSKNKKKSGSEKEINKLVKDIEKENILTTNQADQLIKLISLENYEQDEDLVDFKNNLELVKESQEVISSFNFEIEKSIKYPSQELDSLSGGIDDADGLNYNPEIVGRWEKLTERAVKKEHETKISVLNQLGSKNNGISIYPARQSDKPGQSEAPKSNIPKIGSSKRLSGRK